MLPLDMGTTTLASELKAEIDANASPAATVPTVERWNATGQNWQTFSTVPFPIGDFATVIGYPYRVTVDVASGTTSTWP